jgi:hypothetical protein
MLRRCAVERAFHLLLNSLNRSGANAALAGNPLDAFARAAFGVFSMTTN